MEKYKICRLILSWIGFLLFLLMVFGQISLPHILMYNRTASLPIGWYLILPGNQYHTGDIVAFHCPEKTEDLAIKRGWISPDELMLKKIGSMPDGVYEIQEDNQFWVEENYIGQVLSKDHKDQQMPSIGKGKFVVSAGHFLPITQHPRSFDGRYYGEVPLSNIECKVIPLFTWY